jgi:hypothetical protein
MFEYQMELFNLRQKKVEVQKALEENIEVLSKLKRVYFGERNDILEDLKIDTFKLKTELDLLSKDIENFENFLKGIFPKEN